MSNSFLAVIITYMAVIVVPFKSMHSLFCKPSCFSPSTHPHTWSATPEGAASKLSLVTSMSNLTAWAQSVTSKPDFEDTFWPPRACQSTSFEDSFSCNAGATRQNGTWLLWLCITRSESYLWWKYRLTTHDQKLMLHTFKKSVLRAFFGHCEKNSRSEKLKTQAKSGKTQKPPTSVEFRWWNFFYKP